MNYKCEICKYETPRIANYNRHCESNKHKRNIIVKTVTFSNYCELCNKSFQCSENYHKKFKCKNVVKPDPIEKKQDNDMLTLVLQLMEKQQKTIDLIVNKPTVVNNNIDNSVNNTVKNKTINNTVNVFLNEECKDAINWDDFIKNLQLPNSVDADITDIVRFSIHNQLKELGIYKRPIHCLNTKKKQLCIKNNDQWEEDSYKNHKLFVSSLDQMKNDMIKNWEDKNPKWYEDEEQSSIGPVILNKLDEKVNSKECLTHIMKQTLIDLE